MSYAPMPPQPKRSRRQQWQLVIVSALAAGFAGAVFVGAITAGGEPERDSDQQRVAQPEVVTTTGAPRVELSANQLAYRQALAAIDPDLVPTDGRAVLNDAENTCGDILQGTSHEQLISRVISRTERNEAKVGKAQAEEILKLMKQWICPDWTAEWASKHPSPKS